MLCGRANCQFANHREKQTRQFALQIKWFVGIFQHYCGEAGGLSNSFTGVGDANCRGEAGARSFSLMNNACAGLAPTVQPGVKKEVAMLTKHLLLIMIKGELEDLLPVIV